MLINSIRKEISKNIQMLGSVFTLPSTSITREIAQKTLFNVNFVLPTKKAYFSGHASNSIFVVSDVTTFYRAMEDFVKSILKQTSSKGMALCYQASGLVAGTYVVMGIMNIFSSFSKIRYSSAIEDTRAKFLGHLGIAQGTTLAAAGGSFFVFRSMAIAQTMQDAKPTSLLGRISTQFMNAGLILFAFFFVILSVNFGMQFFEAYTFKKKLLQRKDLASQIEMLQKKLQVDPSKVFAKLVKKCGSEEAAKKELIEEAFSIAKMHMKKHLKELQIENVSEEKLQEIIYQILASETSRFTLTSVPKQVERQLALLGLSAKVEKMQRKKNAKIERVLDKTHIKAIKELSTVKNLVGRIQYGDKEVTNKASHLVTMMTKKMQKQMTVAGACIGVCILGVIAVVAATILTGGTALIAGSGLMFVFSIFMTFLDGYFLLQSYREEPPLSHDKTLLTLSSIMGIFSPVLLTILAITGVLSVGIVPMVIANILAMIWLGQHMATWKIMQRNQRLHEEKAPTLETLLKAFEKGENQRAERMIKNLPRASYQVMQSEMKKHLGNKKEATQAAIQKIMQVKKDEQELLRKIIVSHLEKVSAA